MKINPKHFKFTHKVSRFSKSVWLKYFELKKKKDLTDTDKKWIKDMRQANRESQWTFTGLHVPSKTETSFVIKKPLVKDTKFKKEFITKLVSKVKEARSSLKKVTAVQRNFDGANYNLVGGVFSSPGQIPPMAGKLKTNDPLARKKPRHKYKNYIGVELEFNSAGVNIGQSEIAKRLKDAGLGRYVDVTTDPSCGWEVRVLLLEDEFELHLVKILEVLNSMGFQTDTKCGTHVHLDMRNRVVSHCYNNLFKTQKFLRKFLTRQRKRNTYCRPNKADSFDKQMENGERYHSINVQSFQRHQTLEIRMHQGTLKPKELVPWIKLLLKIVNHGAPIETTVNTLKQAKKQFDIPPELVQDLEDRMFSLFKQKPEIVGGIAGETAIQALNRLIRR